MFPKRMTAGADADDYNDEHPHDHYQADHQDLPPVLLEVKQVHSLTPSPKVAFLTDAGGSLLVHHEAASPMDAVMLVLLGAPREVGFHFLSRGGTCAVFPRSSTKRAIGFWCSGCVPICYHTVENCKTQGKDQEQRQGADTATRGCWVHQLCCEGQGSPWMSPQVPSLCPSWALAPRGCLKTNP